MIRRLDTTTIVLPFEYDVEEFINALIMISNAQKDCLVYCDIGKVVGVYKSALEMYSILLDIIVTNKTLTEGQKLEVEDVLGHFRR